MRGTIRARVKGGMLELLENVDLPEGAEVSVTILEIPQGFLIKKSCEISI